MAGVIGVSAGDILAFGRLCRDIYDVCFSEARGAHKTWESLGNQLAVLGHSLNSLYRNTDVLPLDNEEALLSVRLVIGDFRETLSDLKKFLEKYGALGTPDPSLWTRIKWSTEQSAIEHFDQKISIHIKGIDMMLNPVILQTMRGVDSRTSNIQNTVNGIETRINGIGNVLESLLLVAYEQLPRRQVEWHGNSHGRFLMSTPEYSEDLPSFIHSGSGLAPIARVSTDPALSPAPQLPYDHSPILPSWSGRPATGHPQPSRPGHGQGGGFPRPTPPSRTFTVDSTRSEDQKLNLSETYSSSPQGAPQDPLHDNPLLQRLAKHAEQSNHGEGNRIENWLQAGFWWYFKASAELDMIQDTVSKDAYLGLLKSSWIVNNMIRPYDNGPGLPAKIERNVETLSASILQQWQKIGGRRMPDLRNLGSEDFEIWDEEIQLVPPIGAQLGVQLSPIPAEISHSVSAPPSPMPPPRHSSLPNAASPDRYASRLGSFPLTRQPAALPDRTISRKPLKSPLTVSPTQQFPTPTRPKDPSQPEDQQSRLTSGNSSSSEAVDSLSRRSSEAPSSLGGTSGSSSHIPTSAVEPVGNAFNVSPDEGLRICYGEDSRILLGEQLGEEMVLDNLRISFADRYKGPYTDGFVRVFWRPDDGYFRVLTTWDYHGSVRFRSDDVSRLDTELVAEYAYEERLVIFFRNAHQRAPPIDSLHDHPVQPDRDRISPFYRFQAAEDTLKFQATFTKEKVYVDLVKRVSTVTVKKARTGEHTYGYGRIQLSYDQKAQRSDFSDRASMATGISAGTMAQLRLQWSKMVIFFGPSNCLLFCYITDDIALDVRRDKRTVELKPARHSFLNSPKYVKARTIGTDDRKGGFRLSKHKQSPDDIPNFDDYVYIRIVFKDVHYLKVFVDFWEMMIQSRRMERKRITELNQTLATRRVEANPGT